jgi:hypothetical protein
LRCVVLARLAVALVLSPIAGGCSALRLNGAREFAVYSAGYAGRFHIAYGRWPANVNELEEFVCMRGRADRFGLAQISCDELVQKPYRTQLNPREAYLEMRFFDLAKKPLCSLKVLTPPPRSVEDVFPMVVIRTSVFSCRGDGRAIGNHANRQADTR